jgi:hypothetical protein
VCLTALGIAAVSFAFPEITGEVLKWHEFPLSP